MKTDKILLTKEYIITYSSAAARKKAIAALIKGDTCVSVWDVDPKCEYHIKPSRRKASVQ